MGSDAHLPALLDAFGLDLMRDAVQVVPIERVRASNDASPFEGGLLPVSPLLPLVVMTNGSTDFTSLAVFMARHYGAEWPVRCLADGNVQSVEVRELATIRTVQAVFVAPVDPLLHGRDPRSIQHIVARLRQPDGCPWDRKQTHESLAKNFVDEVYEVVDAVDSGDPAAIAEELGDLLMLIMMQAQIGHEAGTFSLEDVYDGITRKIVGRHPHVFGEAEVKSEADLSVVWAAAKAREVAEGRKHGGKDVDGEPFSMPALTRAARVLKKQPLADDEEAPPFLRLVNDLIAADVDPDVELRDQLRTLIERRLTD